MNKSKFLLFPIIFIAILLSACNLNIEIHATIPDIINISEDTITTINKAVTISIEANNKDDGTLTYQWYTAEGKLDEGSPVTSTTNDANGTLKADFLPDVSKAASSYYYCVVTNTLEKDSKSVVSPRVHVTVLEQINAAKPVIATQPLNFTGKIEDDFSISVSAVSIDEGSISYQWYFSKTDKEEALAIKGGNNSVFNGKISIENLGYYYCEIINTISDNGDGGSKSSSVISNKVILSNNIVNANVPVITSQPESTTEIIPAEHTFTVGAYSLDGGTLTYQWYECAEGASEGTEISGATNSSFKVSVSSAGKTGYYCVITNTLEDNGDGGIKIASSKSSTAWLETVDFTETIAELKFTKQPYNINVVSYNQNSKLNCIAEFESGYKFPIIYQWYESSDGSTENGTKINNGEGYNSSSYTTPAFTEKGIKYYYCVATSKISTYDGTEITKNVTSDVVGVAYTGLPLVKINTVNSEEPTADYVSPPSGCYGAGLKNATKPKARMQIFKAHEEEPVYDSGEYNKEAKTGLTIKLRGNTSAYSNKKPYKIKLQKKADLLADLLPNRTSKHKDKEWILLKDATSLNTFVGMAVADLAGTTWTPEFAFVNVVINDDYRGVYLLIEAITQNETRINIANDGFIIERDAYWWNEDVKFITPLYNQKYTFKYPDDEDITTEQMSYIESYMNTLEQHVKEGSYEDYLDVESFARWLLIHDILGTWDAGGSNVYMSKYDSSDSKIYMSTTWDYDSNYWMENSWSNQHNGNRIYAYPMMTSNNTAFKDSYISQWNNLSSSLWNDLSGKLNELNTAQGEDINLSRKCDAIKWTGSYSTVSDNIRTAENWFGSRIGWLNTAINGL